MVGPSIHSRLLDWKPNSSLVQELKERHKTEQEPASRENTKYQRTQDSKDQKILRDKVT